MTYPQGAPGGPGFPPAQQPTTQFSAPTQQFNTFGETEPAADGPAKLPAYLSAATAVLGLLVYLASFGPKLTLSDAPIDVSISPVRFDLAVAAAVLAALIAGIGLLPKQVVRPAPVAALSVLGFLIAISTLFEGFDGTTVGWGVYLVVAFTLLQAAAAVVVLLFDSGIITPPVPRPKYDQQQQYGQYPGYYGQPGQHGGQQLHAPQHQQVPQQQQRPGYPTPYGAYGGSGQTTGGFQAQQPSGPPTPPTGFPTYGQPPASNTPTTQTPTTHQGQSSSQSDQSSS